MKKFISMQAHGYLLMMAILSLLLDKRWVLRAKQGKILYLTSQGKSKLLNELLKIAHGAREV